MQNDGSPALDPDLGRMAGATPSPPPERAERAPPAAPKALPPAPPAGPFKRAWRSIFGGGSDAPGPAPVREPPVTRSVTVGAGLPPPRYSDDGPEEMTRPATRSIPIERRELVPAEKLGFQPWTTICRLEVTYAAGQRHVASGFLIHPGVVATSAHVILHPDGGIGRATEIAVTPGFDLPPPRRRTLVSRTFRIRDGWGAGPSSFLAANDYGAVLFPDPNAFAGFGRLDWCEPASSDFTGNFAVSGYPAEKHGQWRHWNAVTEVGEVSLRHVVQTTAGQSGSPLFQLKDGVVRVVGIHSRTVGDSNVARRVTDRVLADYRAWIGEIAPVA